MSTGAMTAVFRHSTSKGSARLILLAMADEANDQGLLTAYRRSQSWLARKANVDDGTARRAVASLEALGEIVVLARGDGRRSSDYRIKLPGLDEIEGVQDAPPAPAPRPPRARVSPPQGGQDAPPIIPVSPVSSPPSKETAVPAVAPLVSWELSKVVEEGGRLLEAVELCDLMAKLLRDRGHRVTAETSRSKGWVTPMEALLRIDGRSPEEVARVLRWLDRGGDGVSSFWRVNVLSPAKVRLQWDRMREQYARDAGPRPSRSASALGAGTGPDLADVLHGERSPSVLPIEVRAHG